MDPRHRRLAEIALRAAGDDYGLALAGGYAVRAHGMGDRPSGDVDLFTDWQRRADFPADGDKKMNSRHFVLTAGALAIIGFSPAFAAQPATCTALAVCTRAIAFSPF